MRRSLFSIAAVVTLVVVSAPAFAQQILVPMDLKQTNHLKAYGLAYHALERGQTVDWLLNYRGGSFLMPATEAIILDARLKNVSFEMVSGSDVAQITAEIAQNNMETVRLEKAPEVAVYVPPLKQPWDDAVMLALEYAEIPYERIFDEEVLRGEAARVRLAAPASRGLHRPVRQVLRGLPPHRLVPGRPARLRGARSQAGLRQGIRREEGGRREIRDYVEDGGFLFAMCSACDTFDIALSAAGVDIVAQEFDYDGITPGFQDQLDYDRCLAFTGFKLVTNPLVYEFSDIDTSDYATARGSDADYFTLFEFSAKYDPVPAMLTQNHVSFVNGFLGQTTGFRKQLVKKSVVVLGEVAVHDEVKYLHGNVGRGTFTFLGGHDPEDYQHAVGDPPTDLNLHPNSPGYRLILNNVLFPAAKKKTQKT